MERSGMKNFNNPKAQILRFAQNDKLKPLCHSNFSSKNRKKRNKKAYKKRFMWLYIEGYIKFL